MPEPMIRFNSTCEIQAASDATKKPTFRAVCYSGGPMRVAGFGDVVIDTAGADVSGRIPMLAGHDENDLDSLAGEGTASIEAGQIVVSGILTESTTGGRTVIGLARSGILPQVSVGYAPEAREFIQAGQKIKINSRSITAPQGGLNVIRRGRLREVSFVATGADPSTQVSIAATRRREVSEMSTQDDSSFVSTPEQQDRLDLLCSLPPDDYLKAQEQRVRLINLWGLSDRELSNSELVDQAREIKAQALCGEIGLNDYRKAMVGLLLADKPRHPGCSPSRPQTDQPILQAAFCRSVGLPNIEKHFDAPVLEASDRQFRGGLGLQELLLRCAAGNGYSGRTRVTVGSLSDILRAAFSTHTITTLLTTTGNKMLSDGFGSVEQTWKAVSRTRPLNDFKEATVFRMSADLEYEELGPAGEIKHGTLGQESYSLTAKTFARMLTLTRTDIINDDLGAFNDLRNRLGRGAGLALNKAFWTAFLVNTEFFTAARANLQGSAALTDAGTSLDSANQLFSALVDADGGPLGIVAKILLVPPALSAIARRLYVSGEIRDTTANTKFPTANVWQSRFLPLESAYLSNSSYPGYSASSWYLLADPADLPVVEVGLLGGQAAPTIESADADFNTLGISFRGYHDFAVSKAEYRAGIKSQAAAL